MQPKWCRRYRSRLWDPSNPRACPASQGTSLVTIHDWFLACTEWFVAFRRWLDTRDASCQSDPPRPAGCSRAGSRRGASTSDPTVGSQALIPQASRMPRRAWREPPPRSVERIEHARPHAKAAATNVGCASAPTPLRHPLLVTPPPRPRPALQPGNRERDRTPAANYYLDASICRARLRTPVQRRTPALLPPRSRGRQDRRAPPPGSTCRRARPAATQREEASPLHLEDGHSAASAR
jgi:hypothetical protein